MAKKPCCPLIEDVAGRAKDSDRIGLMFVKNLFTNKRHLHIMMRKAKKTDRPDTFNATYAEVSYCPFCGTKYKAEVADG